VPAAEAQPPWAEALLLRIAFHRSADAAEIAALRSRIAAHPGLLPAFLHASLDALAEAAHHPALPGLCDLARQAIAGDADDRAVNAAAAPLREMPGLLAAASVPGRAVFLAAMARALPEEEAPAAVMLANDMAAVRKDLPLRALRAALETTPC
jgi:hypothetical protein